MTRRFPPIAVAVLFATLLATSTPVAAQEPTDVAPGTRTTRVVGGQQAAVGQFPWTAAVSFRLEGATYSCGGTVVGRSWIVTAAHCVTDLDGRVLSPGAFSVRTGSVSRTSGGQVLAVASVYRHPGYTGDDNDYDVALLRLSRPTTAPAIALIGSTPAEQALDDPGVLATVAGWGATTFPGSPVDRQRFVEVPVISDNSCSAAYPIGRMEEGYPYEFRAQSMVCAGYPAGGKDSCQGDSGGPLATQAADDTWRLIGVVSWGYRCAEAGNPGVYARMTAVSSWTNLQKRFGPFDADAVHFIIRQYVDFANRPPTGTELAQWRTRLASNPPATLVAELAGSARWQTNAGSVTRLYKAAFLRNPDSGGLTHWVNARWGGKGLVSMADHFAASSEFQTRYGTLDDGAYVDRIYQNVFGRLPDSGGRAYWVGKLAAGAGRGTVLFELSDSNEYRSRTSADVAVITTWFGLLRTTPSAAELAQWRTELPRTLVDTLRTSLRYAARFTG